MGIKNWLRKTSLKLLKTWHFRTVIHTSNSANHSSHNHMHVQFPRQPNSLQFIFQNQDIRFVNAIVSNGLRRQLIILRNITQNARPQRLMFDQRSNENAFLWIVFTQLYQTLYGILWTYESIQNRILSNVNWWAIDETLPHFCLTFSSSRARISFSLEAYIWANCLE